MTLTSYAILCGFLLAALALLVVIAACIAAGRADEYQETQDDLRLGRVRDE